MQKTDTQNNENHIPPTLAPDALSRVYEAIGDDQPELVVELLDLYLSESQGLVERMVKSLQEEDLDACYIAAHSLKSSSVTFGAPRLSTMCGEFEAAVRLRAASVDFDASVEEIRAESTDVRQALLAIRQQLLQE